MTSPKVYEEVYEILSYMDKATVMKIPMGILEEINDNRDVNYISRINPEDLFNDMNVERETIVFIAWLDYNYWADPDEKERLHELFVRNQYEYEEELKRRFYTSNKPMFFDDINGQGETAVNENEIAVKENNFLINLKNIIKKILSKFKRK